MDFDEKGQAATYDERIRTLRAPYAHSGLNEVGFPPEDIICSTPHPPVATGKLEDNNNYGTYAVDFINAPAGSKAKPAPTPKVSGAGVLHHILQLSRNTKCVRHALAFLYHANRQPAWTWAS